MKVLKFSAGALVTLALFASSAFADEETTGVKKVVVSEPKTVLGSQSTETSIQFANAKASLTLTTTSETCPEVCLNGGAIALADGTADVLNSSSMWFDASDATTFTPFKIGGVAQYVTVDGVQCPVCQRWDDVRGNNRSIYLEQTHPSVDWVAPFLRPDALNGLSVAEFFRETASDDRTRYFFKKSNQETTVTPKLVIMVFGSQLGGGYALFGNPDGVFARAGSDIKYPILPSTATNCRLWLDGQRAEDPTDAYFNGGWQVISFDPAGAAINGLALKNTSTTAGNCSRQRFGEILFFNEDLDDESRQKVEWYLACKWGLRDNFVAAREGKVRLNGTGLARLDSDVVLGGVFSGELDLNGHTARIDRNSPSESDVLQIGNRVAWFDPSDAESLETVQVSVSNRMESVLKKSSMWFDASDATTFTPFKIGGVAQYVTVDGVQCPVCQRWDDVRGNNRSIYLEQTHPSVDWVAPFLRPDALNGLSVAEFFRETASDDRTRYFFKKSNQETTVTPKLVIMVFGSQLGGGYALFGNPDGVFARVGSDIKYPILPSTATNCRLWLDGQRAEDPTDAYFNGGWQVISFDPAGAAINGLALKNTSTTAGNCSRQRFGEILFFNEDLDEDERQLVEWYLAKKWGLDATFDPPVPEDWKVRYCTHLNDRVRGTATGTPTIYGDSSRRCAIGTGSRANWLDFRHGSGNWINGRMMRMKTYPHEEDGTLIPLNVKTVVMAEDSSAGGGTPFLTGITGSETGIYQRYEAGEAGYTAGTYADPIWSPKTAATYRDESRVYVDGILTDAKTQGFNGRKEVYTTLFDGSALPLSAFGDIFCNVCTNAAGEKTGEILGEMLMYDRVLTDAERQTAEAYLISKWCGRSAVGYGDYSQATVIGSGNVVVSAGANAPRFGTGFSGNVSFDATTMQFDIDGVSGLVKNPIVVETGAMIFKPAVTVKVSASRVGKGTYRLVTGQIPACTTWTLDLTGAQGALKNASLSIGVSSIDLVVPPPGLAILVR